MADRICVTRRLKLDRHARTFGGAAPPPKPSTHLTEPVFQGTVHLVALSFQTPQGAVGVLAVDHDTALSYLSAAAPPVEAYCSAYSPNVSISVDPKLGTYLVTPSGGATYTDAELAGWIDAYASANGIPAGDAVAVFNPPSGVENSDAPVSQGVLGYHSISPGGVAYIFVNALGSGFTVGDAANVYAQALSHELAEMAVDPRADGVNPEVCDQCSGNCGPAWSDFFDASGNYVGGGPNGVPVAGSAFFVNSVCTPASVSSCPAPSSACLYPPPGSASPPPPTPDPCLALLDDGIASVEEGNVAAGIVQILDGISCYVSSGAVDATLVMKEVLRRLSDAL